MFKRTILLVCSSLVLTACAVGGTAGRFHPSIITNGVDMDAYERDRKECEVKIKSTSSNYELTDLLHFRMCIHAKGYKLLN